MGLDLEPGSPQPLEVCFRFRAMARQTIIKLDDESMFKTHQSSALLPPSHRAYIRVPKFNESWRIAEYETTIPGGVFRFSHRTYINFKPVSISSVL